MLEEGRSRSAGGRGGVPRCRVGSPSRGGVPQCITTMIKQLVMFFNYFERSELLIDGDGKKRNAKKRQPYEKKMRAAAAVGPA